MFVPIVVTTAKLFMATYDHKKIDISKGRIDPRGLTLEAKQRIEYLFPLQSKYGVEGYIDGHKLLKPLKRKTYIVSADFIVEFCNTFVDDVAQTYS